MTFFVENAWPNTKAENNVTGILTVKKDSPKSVTTASCIAAMPGKCDEDNRPTISILVVEKYGCTALLPLYSPSLSDLFHFPLILTKKLFWIWDVDLFPLAFVVFLPAEGDIVPLKLLALSLLHGGLPLSLLFPLFFPDIDDQMAVSRHSRAAFCTRHSFADNSEIMFAIWSMFSANWRWLQAEN